MEEAVVMDPQEFGRVVAIAERVETKLNRIERVLLGNGSGGLVQRVHDLERDADRRKWQVRALVTGALGAALYAVREIIRALLPL